MKLDGFKCQRCPSREKLQVHHKSYKNLWREPLSDLLTLCKSCHEQEHFPGVPKVITGRYRPPRRLTRKKTRVFKAAKSKPRMSPVKVYFR